MKLVPRFNGRSDSFRGGCVLSETVRVENGDFADWCLSAFLVRTGRKTGERGVSLLLQRDSSLPEEGYCLTVTEESISVSAASERGVVWALTTAACLLSDGKLPCCEIKDEPGYPFRGAHLDCARHFFPPDEVKRIVEGLALAKMNVFHWHLTDDQGWRIESRRFPKLHEVSEQYYTQEEIVGLVEFARIRGVEVIPEIDLPGHVSAVLAAYPEYSCTGKHVPLAKTGGIYPIILCPGREETFSFLKELLEEIVPLFPGPRFHIGGDEAPKGEWARCPHCRRKMKAMGFSDPNQLQGYFTNRVRNMLKAFGKQAVCWNETLLAANAPEDIVVQYWTLQHRAAMEPYIRAKKPWVYSEMFDFYFDYPHSMSPLKKVYSALPKVGKTVCGPQDGLLGMECCLWTEHISQPEKLEQKMFPRAYAVAELCWAGPGDYREFRDRLAAQMNGLPGRTVSFTPMDLWDPEGEDRRRETAAFLKKLSGMTREAQDRTMDSIQLSGELLKNFATRFFRMGDLPFLMRELTKEDE